MGRWPTHPLLFDELKTVSIADLKRYGYLEHGHHSGVMSWSRLGVPTGSIRLTSIVFPETGEGLLWFSYTIEDKEQYSYLVHLFAVPSNLGVGQRWYFVCARTGKRCIKLHLANGYFQHRSGIPGAMYSIQTYSRESRMLHAFIDGFDALMDFKANTYYRGEKTKRYKRLLKRYWKVIPWLEKEGYDLEGGPPG